MRLVTRGSLEASCGHELLDSSGAKARERHLLNVGVEAPIPEQMGTRNSEDEPTTSYFGLYKNRDNAGI
jgi:hypothetical protein